MDMSLDPRKKKMKIELLEDGSSSCEECSGLAAGGENCDTQMNANGHLNRLTTKPEPYENDRFREENNVPLLEADVKVENSSDSSSITNENESDNTMEKWKRIIMNRPMNSNQLAKKQKLTSQRRALAASTDDKASSCHYCTFRTGDNAAMKRHEYMYHAGRQLLACDRCPFKTYTNALLISHTLTHGDEKPFECALCSYKAKTSGALKRHALAVHAKAKPFACKYCLFRTAAWRNLKNHETCYHTGDRWFFCDLCPYKTTINHNLKLHLISNHHKGNKALCCELCSFKTPLRKTLNWHILTNHAKKKICQ